MAAARSLRLTRIELRDFRNHERLTLEPSQPFVVLVGPNGAGKTNLLEAASMACSGSSPRTSSELRCIRDGQPFARVSVDVSCDGRTSSRAVVLDGARGKRLEVDGQVERSLEGFATAVPVATFLPERLLVVRGAPARRRQLLDRLVARVHPEGASIQNHYSRALTQRNNLLRRARVGAAVGEAIRPWTEAVVEWGSRIREARNTVLESLNPCFRERFSQLTGFTDGALEIELRGDPDIAAALASTASIEQRRGSTMVGPHLDELTYRQGGRNLRTHGSTGEQRAALLAWSLADADIVIDRTGLHPILLLDEPYAELDHDRRRKLTLALATAPFVMVTTTEAPRHLSDPEIAGSVAVYRVSSGSVTACDTNPTPPT